MAIDEPRRPIRPGQRAPDFALPAADREGTVSLSEHRGQRAVFLALFRGLYCPFCRRQMVKLGAAAERLRAAGVATVAVIATEAARARLYFRFRPSWGYPIAADPDLVTHRAYGLPQYPKTPEIMTLVEAAAADLAGDLGIPTRPGEAVQAIMAADGFEPVETDARDEERDQALIIGQFLIDRDGVVRWVNIERKPGDLPSEHELLAAAAAL